MYLEWISMGQWYIYIYVCILSYTNFYDKHSSKCRGIMVNIHNRLMDVMGVAGKND